MSNQPSKPDQLRFSGPELGDLLDRVVSEHGEEAAIAAVNRIRSGGVAGFFCREEFEVIVDPEGEATAEPGDTGLSDDARPSDSETIADVIGRSAEERPPARLADVAAATDEGDTAPVDTETSTSTPTPTATPVEIDDEPVTGASVEPSVFGGPVAPGADPARDRFLALLERRLDEASAAEDEQLRRRARPASRRIPDEPMPAVPVAPAPMPAATATRPVPMEIDRSADRPASASPSPSDGVGRRGPRAVFWQRLDRVTDELASFLPDGSHHTAVVGPLPLVSAVVTRLQSTPELASADVVVLTDRAGIVSEPTWRLERNGDRLLRAVEEAEGRPVIVVIDVPGDLPAWVGSLQRRLRSAGIGLFRYALSGQPTSAELERYRQGADVPYAIDLTSRVEPGLVVGLIADRHPIVSVAGAELGPELLLALRRHAGAIEPSVEPMIDG